MPVILTLLPFIPSLSALCQVRKYMLSMVSLKENIQSSWALKGFQRLEIIASHMITEMINTFM